MSRSGRLTGARSTATFPLPPIQWVAAPVVPTINAWGPFTGTLGSEALDQHKNPEEATYQPPF